MRTQTLPLGGCNYDQGIVIERMAPQKGDQLSDSSIRVRDRAIIGRCVRSMGILQMYPEKKWPLFVASQPLRGTCHNLIPMTFHGLEATLATFRLVETGVVDIEAAIIALEGSIAGIQHNRSHKRCRAVSVRMKQVGQVRQRRSQRDPEFACPMGLGIGAGKNARGGNHGDGRLRVGLSEDDSLTRNRIQTGSQAAM